MSPVRLPAAARPPVLHAALVALAAVALAGCAAGGASGQAAPTARAAQGAEARGAEVALTSEAVHGGTVGWRLARVADVGLDGAAVSAAGYDDGAWTPAVVPGTVLTTLVEAGVYPDPYVGLNNALSAGLIPDAHRDGRETYHVWYRAEVEAPPSQPDGRVWLRLDGVNYRAHVWMNGRPVGGLEGMFQRGLYDVTGHVRPGRNALAVRVEPPDHPGGLRAEGHPWMDDNVEVYLDLGGQRAAEYDADDYAVRIRPGDPRISGSASAVERQTVVQHAWAERPGGYAVEVRLPWSALAPSFDPEAGAAFGLDVHVGDDDVGGEAERSKLVWAGVPGDAQHRDPRAFGHAALSATAGAADAGEGADGSGTAAIAPAPAPPALDGQRDAVYDAAATLVLDGPRYLPTTGPDDLAATAALLWDAEHLYVLVEVTDDTLVVDSGGGVADGAVAENANGGDGEIGRDVTMLMTAGWDFTYPDGIRDRNTGLWRGLSLVTTGPVDVRHPSVRASLPLPDTSRAALAVSAEVVNASGQAQAGTFVGEVLDPDGRPTGLRFAEPVRLAPGETRTVVAPALALDQPRLWWTHDKGPQPLYTLGLRFEQGGGGAAGPAVSDAEAVRFGVRDVEPYRAGPDSVLAFRLNGERLFVRGGNWIPEAMQRTGEARQYAEMRYTRQSGVNLLRLWAGGVSESDDFFRFADEMGVLVWHEFWLTGNTVAPADTALYLRNVADTVRRLRNRPSLAYYVATNERDGYITAIRDTLAALDGTRGFQRQSECCGVHDGSPYRYVNPTQYWDDTASERGSRIYGFSPEYGAPALPTADALREAIPDSALWPIDRATWDYLDGGGFHLMTTRYAEAVGEYGPSDGIDAFAQKAQLVNATAYRALWEAWNRQKFEAGGGRFATGALFWYHNSPHPQTSGRMWDWSLEPTAALYAAQDALGAVHAQLDPLTRRVSVATTGRQPVAGTVRARVVALDGRVVHDARTLFEAPPDGVAPDVLAVPEAGALGVSGPHFVRLDVEDAGGRPVSDSFVWLSGAPYEGPWTGTGPLYGPFDALGAMPPVALDVDVREGPGRLVVALSNPTEHVALAVDLRVLGADGRPVRPLFYSDDFVSLLPGEARTLTVEAGPYGTDRAPAVLVVEPYNGPAQRFAVGARFTAVPVPAP